MRPEPMPNDLHDRFYLDAPLHGGIEPALLWSMRAWVVGFTRQIITSDRIDRLWTDLAAPEAARHLNQMMRALASGATRTLEIHCVCNTEISEDEVTLLTLMLQPQTNDNIHRPDLLGLTTIASASEICEHAGQLRQALVDAGHRVAPESLATLDVAMPGLVRPIDRH
jgi:hypothetical protein